MSSTIYLLSGEHFDVVESGDEVRRKLRGDSDELVEFTGIKRAGQFLLIFRNDKFVAVTDFASITPRKP